MQHSQPHPLAGQTITITPAHPLPTDPVPGPVSFRVEDWDDRVFGKPWMDNDGNRAALAYAMRSAMGKLPIDNQVVYGKCPSGLGHLVHVSEITGELPTVKDGTA
jgi:hypothetical protein